MDTYLTVSSPTEGFFRDRGSKFIAYSHHVQSEKEIHDLLESLRKANPKACHICYAWRMGQDKNYYRANDDGKPGGTAGKPILGQIDSFGLSNVVVFVVRYFGGTLLGTSGLIEAYKSAARDALSQAALEEKIIQTVFSIRFQYANMSDVMNAIKKLGISVLEQNFENTPTLTVAVRRSEYENAKNVMLEIENTEITTP